MRWVFLSHGVLKRADFLQPKQRKFALAKQYPQTPKTHWIRAALGKQPCDVGRQNDVMRLRREVRLRPLMRQGRKYTRCPKADGRDRRIRDASYRVSSATGPLAFTFSMATQVRKLFTLPPSKNSSRVRAVYSSMSSTFIIRMKSVSPVT